MIIRTRSKIILQLGLVLLIQAAFTSAVQAAIVSLSSDRQDYQVGDTFTIALKLDSQGEYINAAQIDLAYDNRLLELTDFSKGDSVISFWVTEPSLAGNPGSLVFAGGIPNGFEGKGGLLASLVFKATVAGKTEIKISPTSRALLNDGQGSQAKLSADSLEITIADRATGQPQDQWQASLASDEISPEPFKIHLNRSDKIFGGQYFIAFSTNDKQTGVAYYEVREGEAAWQRTSSPYLLKNQNLNRAIAVRTVDQAGNERVEIMGPSRPATRPDYLWWLALPLLAFVVFFSYLLMIRLNRKSHD